VVGVPKTVDNDIPIIDKSFGFETAVEEAQRAITAANVECRSFPHGVGIVQLMGRNSGEHTEREIESLPFPSPRRTLYLRKALSVIVGTYPSHTPRCLVLCALSM